jgi:hypothetical protein
MTKLRMALTIFAAFLVLEVLETLIHGFVLADDYAPYYGTLLRSGDGPAAQMLLLPVAHLCFVFGLVFIFTRLPLAGSRVTRGLKIGVLGWLVGQAPVWLLWYAEQPWPGALVLKQLALELAAALVVGLTIAFVAGRGVLEPRAA